MLHPTATTHAPDAAAACERINWLYLGGNMAGWDAEYATLRGREHADAALAAEIDSTALLAAQCRLFERGSLAADMWGGIAEGYECRLRALLALRTPAAEVTA